MDLTLYQLNNKQNYGQCTSSSVPIIPKWVGLTRTEDPSWACPSAIPDGNVPVDADFPRGKEDGSHVVITYLRGKEDGSHVVITCLYHLENLPKLINIGWEVSGSEPRFRSDGIKLAFRHEFPKAMGE